MNTKFSTSWNSFSLNFISAPFELQFFFAFCAFVTVFELLILPFFPEGIKESIIPVTGWNMAMPYGFNFMIIGSFLIKPKSATKKLTLQYGNILMLAIPIVFGMTDLLTWEGGYEGNPYLFRSPLRPLWTIALPLVWIVLLLSPRIKKYIQLLQSSEAII